MIDSLRSAIYSEYRRRTPASKVYFGVAQRSLPGGDTRSNTFFFPYPTFIRSGAGSHLVDADGNEYLDFAGNYASMIHGHAHPEIVNAVEMQLRRGIAFGSPLEQQSELAAEICSRIPSIERVRFCNSGTEATLNAIRAAKAFTGRNKILKMEGGFHGTHDAAEISVAPAKLNAGPVTAPASIAATEGLFRGVPQDVVVAPFNNIEATRAILAHHAADLAAVIIEPVMGVAGMIPATREYLCILREETQRYGALLIFDEILTLRLAFGGAQEAYGVRPDLTTLGKIIGGGFPIGAFGGAAEIMALYDPQAARLYQSGTFNGNAIAMVAGLTALRLLSSKKISELNAAGDRLRYGLAQILAQSNLGWHVSGSGSLMQIHPAPGPFLNYRDTLAARADEARLLHLYLLNHGLFLSPRNSVALSTLLTELEVDHFLEVFASLCCCISPNALTLRS
ncbi:MAG TPA: aspartate aminotransferase family protein [Bryobacteraceae bacterium]|jgi:glutamate-1-semialdehyde 2,1-aminomutase|nr:aspartate aminotransferase family protein [Bryobacteraceae bacterium]